MSNYQTKGSFVFYESYYEKYIQLSDINPQLAKELLEATIEYGLFGEYTVSKENEAIISALLSEATTQMDKNNKRYKDREEATRLRKAEEKKLAEIADMLMNGMKQKDIAAALGITAGTVSKRIALIREEYPEYLEPRPTTEELLGNPSENNSNLGF